MQNQNSMAEEKISGQAKLIKKIPNINLMSSRSSQQTPLPMQYLGAKNRISKWILNEIDTNFSNIKFF